MTVLLWITIKPSVLIQKMPKSMIAEDTPIAKKGEYDRAIVDYDKAIRLDPKYTRAYYSRGRAYRLKGEYDRAIADYDKDIRLDPENAKVYYYSRGYAYSEKGEYDRAIVDYDKAIRLDPENAKVYYYSSRGYAYSAQRRV